MWRKSPQGKCGLVGMHNSKVVNSSNHGHQMTQYITMVNNLILSKMENDCQGLESIETLQNVLQEYEIHIKTIEEQLDMCKRDHTELRAEVIRLTEENKSLCLQLRNKCESGEFDNTKHLNYVEKLTQQLALALEERDTLEGLWKVSVEEVESLKETLHQYKSGKQLMLTQSKLNNVQKDYSEAINLLESKLTSLAEENDQLKTKKNLLEDQLKQATNQSSQLAEKNASLNQMLNTATQQEQEWKLRYLTIEAKYIELNNTYQADKMKFARVYEYEKVESSLKNKLESALRQRDELQSALEKCHETKAELLKAAAHDRARVEEAVALVDGAMAAQNQALLRDAKSTEESQRIKEELTRLIEEARLRVDQEVADTKVLFQNQLADAKRQLSIVEQECNRKTVEVEHLQKECARLENLLLHGPERIVAGKKDKQIDRLTSEVRLAEGECIELNIENEELRANIIRLQDRCRKSSKEKVQLKADLCNLQQQHENCQRELTASIERSDLLNSELHHTSLQLAKLHRDVICQREHVIDTESRTANLNKAIEIYKKLDSSYNQMNGKWKNEMNALTEKFEAKIKKYKTKNRQLGTDLNNVETAT